MRRLSQRKGFVLSTTLLSPPPLADPRSPATGIEGIFRLSGSEKRIKELKSIFDSPDRYGKGLVWDGYTVHDAANVLRRYLNDLPEPVVPLDLYERFRDPLRGATKQAVGDAEGPQFVDNFDDKAAIGNYQRLITELPPLNRQLLLYILDLLAVFAAKSDENRMNSQNLAAIFQPGMLSHPSHAMAPEEYRLNQCVLIFLIENQDHFLIGMQGTAADEKTKQEVESGTPTGPLSPMPSSASALGRSASNASAGATSVRRDGKIRRNRSVSSRNSRQDSIATPKHSPLLTATASGGLARSNTVPSKRSPRPTAAAFARRASPAGSNLSSSLQPMTESGPAAPPTDGPSFPATDTAPAPVIIAPGKQPLLSAAPPPVAAAAQETRPSEVMQEMQANQARERNLPALFQRAPADSGVDRRQPNKLKKKRIPGSSNMSAHSSSASLTHSSTASPAAEMANPMEFWQPVPSLPSQPLGHWQPPQPPPLHNPTLAASPPTLEAVLEQQADGWETALASSTAAAGDIGPLSRWTGPALPQLGDAPLDPKPRAPYVGSTAGASLHPDDGWRGRKSKSPPASLRSSSIDGSEAEHKTADEATAAATGSPDKREKRRWRLSRGRKDDFAAAAPKVGLNEHAAISSASIASAASRHRKSLSAEAPPLPPSATTATTPPPPTTTTTATQNTAAHDAASGRDEPKGPIGWIRSKYREAKENVEQRRNKSPSADRSAPGPGRFPDPTRPDRGPDELASEPPPTEKPWTVAANEALDEISTDAPPPPDPASAPAPTERPAIELRLGPSPSSGASP